MRRAGLRGGGRAWGGSRGCICVPRLTVFSRRRSEKLLIIIMFVAEVITRQVEVLLWSGPRPPRRNAAATAQQRTAVCYTIIMQRGEAKGGGVIKVLQVVCNV